MQKNEKSAELISAGGKVIDRKLLTIRDTLRSGDAGYIIYMHGWIYKKEQDYSTVFEGYVAQTFYEFLQSYDSGRDHLWVAEYDGQIVFAAPGLSWHRAWQTAAHYRSRFLPRKGP